MRAACLVRAALLLRERRDELAGLVIRETGHTWRDADGEACAAIDWLEYHAREGAASAGARRLGRFAGELNELIEAPRGVALAACAWSEPVSSPARLASAALVTGNAVLLTAPHQSIEAATALVAILREAGCPDDALRLLALDGGGAAELARDPRVGAAIGTAPDADAPAGRNAIVIDASADLDAAVLGVRQSAFGFQGQRRSSAGRAIVVESAHDVFLERLGASTRSLRVGDPIEPGVDVGPVIDEAARARILAAIDEGRGEARLAVALDGPPDAALAPNPAYVAPPVFADVRPGAHGADVLAASHAPRAGAIRAARRAASPQPADDGRPRRAPGARGDAAIVHRVTDRVRGHDAPRLCLGPV
jgi:acyl-CoA reductase-like NAD-dependent aldehyde dehydrogenase